MVMTPVELSMLIQDLLTPSSGSMVKEGVVHESTVYDGETLVLPEPIKYVVDSDDGAVMVHALLVAAIM